MFWNFTVFESEFMVNIMNWLSPKTLYSYVWKYVRMLLSQQPFALYCSVSNKSGNHKNEIRIVQFYCMTVKMLNETGLFELSKK